MKRLRLSTLLLLIVIAALCMALVVQHERLSRRVAELQARLAQEREFGARVRELNKKIKAMSTNDSNVPPRPK
jgi:type II secretory pathway component PulM